MLRHGNYWFSGSGHNVKIHSSAIMGDPGFGFERDEKGYNIPLTRRDHPFSIVIGDHVEIGANSVVHRGRWRDTVIGEDTKIDSLVHVAHNVVIGKHCLVVAGSVLGGSTTIGDHCFLGINIGIGKDEDEDGGKVSIMQGVTIADNVTIGMGSVVRHDITQSNSTWAGNPCVKIADTQRF